MNPKNVKIRKMEKKKLKPNWNPHKKKISNLLEIAESLRKSKNPQHKKASETLIKKAKKLTS